MKIIEVKGHSNYVGSKSLLAIENRVKKLTEEGVTGIVVDIDGLAMNEEFVPKVAEIMDSYNCRFEGLGEKEGLVDAYISSGYFLKRKMGVSKFVRWFRDMVEEANFPIMIMDNRLAGDELIIMNVVQPMRFDDKYLYYRVIKPHLLEPASLEKAVTEGQNIWSNRDIRLVDLAKEDVGIRFAANLRERTMLDIFSGIIDKSLKGFLESSKERGEITESR
ncbi:MULTISPECIES: hypothetical protein [Bacillus]|uniref:hypothetical protein n=1 Tax=Bacillus TaxID=1386 RepID=UPI000E49CF03|nr:MULTISPECIES: hypothetical protein [Bacillus]MCY8636573.1 hypothetical protein [Bacillus sp. S17B2]MBT3123336.1 hypothetical protein [Bacillus inaquosorum]MCB4338922.1 hypothetical protein [Bacillus subtilis]MCB5337194.1 hypothetical protein [Bacillus amyloliquefaciens]MCF7615516.1 hypothetical protein [Bacillus subtilis]